MIEFEVKNMSCGHCVGMVTQAVKLVDPDAKVEVDLGGKKVKIESDKNRASFAEALAAAGYPPV